MRFATKIGLSVAVVTLLAVPLLEVAVFYQARTILQERIVHEQVESAKGVMRTIDSALYQAYLNVSMIAADDLLRTYVDNPGGDAKGNMAESELEERERLTGPWNALEVFDSKGHALFGPKPLGAKKNISAYPSNRIGFEFALQGKIYYSDQIICPKTGRPLVIFAAPVYSRSKPGKVAGVVIAQYQWLFVQQVLDHVDPSAVVHLLNRHGRVIGQRSSDIFTDEHMAEGRRPAVTSGATSSYFVETTLHGGGRALDVELGQSGLKDYHGSGWILLIEQPLETIFAPISRMARNMALLALVLLLLLGGLQYMLVLHFLRPLDDLLQGVKGLGGGRFGNKVAVRNKDEFGELADSFNAMVDKLREAQEELIRKEKQALLGLVAAGVGNELRNPLGVMNNAVYFLQARLADADDSVKEYLGIIRDEIVRSERIAVELTDAVRTRPPELALHHVAQLVEEVLRGCSIPASVSVTVDIPEALPPIRVDAAQVKHVFANLISNAVDAMPQGGALEIGAVENKPEASITISVRDNGIGMTAEQMGKLFQPLFTTKARGIGLGLVVVKNLTQANGGNIEVQSEPGKGTLCRITLPGGSPAAETT